MDALAFDIDPVERLLCRVPQGAFPQAALAAKDVFEFRHADLSYRGW
ncbi:MAG: hypothetical protein BWY52_01881 [Chloroflexi bacterium ADurb.Bin325]|nr:MAG: hypothetical protein BWY52_01881 [Chloroflexi bacterium ADurb.Bin325]